MKKKILSFSILYVILVGCTKEPITPGNYAVGSTPNEIRNNNESSYNYKGVLPSWNSQIDGLVGTKWVLRKMTVGFSTTSPNDTITFISSTNYILNSNAPRPYNLTSSVASTNKTLTLYYFYPFGGSHYSGEVGESFISEGGINACKFINIQNSTPNIIAYFEKI
jgi:hypothetical protein